MRAVVSTLALCVIVAGCGGSPTQPSLPFRQLKAQGLLAQPFACTAGTRVFRDADEWNAFASGILFAEPPSVDFRTEMVVLVALGTRGSSGYTVDIQDVRRSGEQLSIQAIETTPGKCAALTVITCPWAAVVVPRSDATVAVKYESARTAPGC